ncbi:MAG: Hpt domain-containing protein [bacterium]|nr:Hpt domain-containing protein [bacterium]
MDERKLSALAHCETDIQDSLQRFCGDEELYLSYLYDFLTEPTMDQLENAIMTRTWHDAFIAAHALKGLAGNLGLIPLYHATGELVVLLRAGRIDEVGEVYRQAKRSYNALVDAICTGDEELVGGETR